MVEETKKNKAKRKTVEATTTSSQGLLLDDYKNGWEINQSELKGKTNPRL